MFEADRLPMDWVRACNQMDELWVPSRFNAEVFASSGVERDKLVIIPGAVNPREFDPTSTHRCLCPIVPRSTSSLCSSGVRARVGRVDRFLPASFQWTTMFACISAPSFSKVRG
jgi:hypothetical protein